MKNLFNVIVFFKRPGIIFRLIGICFCYFLTFYETIPDLKFDLSAKYAQEFTQEQIVKSPKKSFPSI